MKVAIVGAGHVGVAIGAALHRVGHAIMYGVQKPEVANADQATVGIAASHAEAIILAIPFGAVDAVTKAAGGFAGKVVIDATNPLGMAANGLGLTMGFEPQARSRLQRACRRPPCSKRSISDANDPTVYSAEDLITQGFLHSPPLMALLEDTKPASTIDPASFDAIVIAGGQAPMVTMERATALHALFARFYETGKVACALRHGTAILRYATLQDGSPLVRGKIVTGFANVEEEVADNAVWNLHLLPGDKHVMPWRIEDELKKLGANFVQAGLWRGFAMRDGNLVTGQQNFSGMETAEAVIRALGE